MHIDTVQSPNGKTHHYLRQSYRVGKSVRKRTLAKLSDLPQPALRALQRALQNKNAISLDSTDDCRILRSLPHGHVLAALHALRRSGLPADLHPAPSRDRDLAIALIVARLLFPKSKRITRFLIQNSPQHTLATSSLGLLLRLGAVGHNEPYQTLDWLLQHQADIESRLARRHLNAGSLVLYDVTSTYFEGRRCELATHGYSRDHRADRPQIVIGLLASEDGCPLGVEVFPGNTSDPKTLTAQLQQVQRRFGAHRLIWVGDRGMITSARIREDFRSRPELDWVSALRADQIKTLVDNADFQPSLFDQHGLAEINSSLFPGERLVVCHNPRVATERARKREALLDTTETQLLELKERTQRPKRPLRKAEAITVAATRILDRRKMRKHFLTDIKEAHFSFQRDQDSITREAALDGFYVIRTSLRAQDLPAERAVLTYKRLGRIEAAFATLKSDEDLRLRPIRHFRDHRVRAHVFLCMLALYVEWHLRRDLAPLTFQDEDPAGRDAARPSPVHPAAPSPAAKEKRRNGRASSGLPLISFPDLLDQLKSVTLNRVRLNADPPVTFYRCAEPSDHAAEAFRLLQIRISEPNIPCSQ